MQKLLAKYLRIQMLVYDMLKWIKVTILNLNSIDCVLLFGVAFIRAFYLDWMNWLWFCARGKRRTIEMAMSLLLNRNVNSQNEQSGRPLAVQPNKIMSSFWLISNKSYAPLPQRLYKAYNKCRINCRFPYCGHTPRHSHQPAIPANCQRLHKCETQLARLWLKQRLR